VVVKNQKKKKKLKNSAKASQRKKNSAKLFLISSVNCNVLEGNANTIFFFMI
jgi:hypothetical protein